MSIYRYLYVYIYIYIHMNVCIWMSLYRYLYVYIYIYIHMYVCIWMSIYRHSARGEAPYVCRALHLYIDLDVSCHTHEWVMSHIWMSHVTHTNTSCHTDRFPRIAGGMRSGGNRAHATHTNELCHAYEWVMSPTWLCYITHMNESCHTHSCPRIAGGMRSGGTRARAVQSRTSATTGTTIRLLLTGIR